MRPTQTVEWMRQLCKKERQSTCLILEHKNPLLQQQPTTGSTLALFPSQPGTLTPPLTLMTFVSCVWYVRCVVGACVWCCVWSVGYIPLVVSSSFFEYLILTILSQEREVISSNEERETICASSQQDLPHFARQPRMSRMGMFSTPIS